MLLTSALTLRAIDLGQVEEELVVLALGVAQRRLRRHLERLVLADRVLSFAGQTSRRARSRAVLGRDLQGVAAPCEVRAPCTARA